MANFQRTVIIVSVCLFILTLILIYIVLTKSKNNKQWPPLLGNCPDYWDDSVGDGTACTIKKNTGQQNMGTCPVAPDFSKAPYVGATGTCAKFNWANTCGITWDGITSGVINPCTPPAAPAK